MIDCAGQRMVPRLTTSRNLANGNTTDSHRHENLCA